MVVDAKSLKNGKTPLTTTFDTSTTISKSASVGQQTDACIVEQPSSNQVSATISKSEPLTHVNAVVITARANKSAPAVFSSATKLLVNDILAKTPIGGAIENGSSSTSTLTWMDFTDLFSTSVESLSKLCGEAGQQRAKKSFTAEEAPNVTSSGSDAFADLLKVFAFNWSSNDSSNTNSRSSETDLNTQFQVNSANSCSITTGHHTARTAMFDNERFVSAGNSTNLEYNSVDKLQLRLAIAKAANFNEFVRLYFNNGGGKGAESSVTPTLPQIIKLAELLFKDYQQSVLQLSNA